MERMNKVSLASNNYAARENLDACLSDKHASFYTCVYDCFDERDEYYESGDKAQGEQGSMTRNILILLMYESYSAKIYTTKSITLNEKWAKPSRTIVGSLKCTTFISGKLASLMNNSIHKSKPYQLYATSDAWSHGVMPLSLSPSL